MKIGDMLVKEGLITREQLIDALLIQKDDPTRKIGEVLLENGWIDIDKFTEVLDRQMEERGLKK